MVSVPDCLERISAVLQLLGQLENSGPPPANKVTIAKLPRMPVIQKDIDLERVCSVCMEAFELNEYAKKLPCGHFFHAPCIEPWLERHNTCPICRKVVEVPPCRSSTRTFNNPLVNAIPALYAERQSSSLTGNHNDR